MSRILIDPAMPTGKKFIGGPELSQFLWFRAMCYSALTLSDGFVPDDAMFAFSKARRPQVDNALAHLSTVQPGCDHPSVYRKPGGWLLHDYDDPIYANPLRDGVQALQLQRRKSASTAGKASAAVRRAKYGTAQPPRVQISNDSPNGTPNDSFENRSSEETTSTERLPERPSRTTPNGPALHSTAKRAVTAMPADEENVSTEHGDDAMQVASNGVPSPQVQVLRLLDWFMAKHGWSTWSDAATQKREAQRAIDIIELAFPRNELYASLDAMWDETDPDDRPSSLGFFWTRLQLEQHATLKAPRSHVGSDGPTKISPAMPAGRGKR